MKSQNFPGCIEKGFVSLAVKELEIIHYITVVLL